MDGRYNNERGNLQKKPKISLKTNIVRIFWQLRAKMTLETLDFSGFGRDAVEMREARLGH